MALGVEDFTLLIDHAVEGRETGLGGISTEMNGELQSHDIAFCRMIEADATQMLPLRWEGEACFVGKLVLVV